MATVTHPRNRNVELGRCPETFEAEPYTKVSLSGYDVATVDASGQHPTLADQLASTGVPLTREQWERFSTEPNPSWTPTYKRVVLGLQGQVLDPDNPDDAAAIAEATVEHQVAVCPSCGSPIKVG